jgi:hypothetical protein
MKKVSVIMPAYNAENFIRRSLDSLVGQTIGDGLEIIVVNDGSTDETWGVMQEYAQKYPALIQIYTKENGGQATARNMAIPFCTGEYVCCIDSDDYVASDMFEKMYDLAIKEQADMVVCDSYEDIGGNLRRITYKDYPDKRYVYIDGWVSPCNKIYKRSILMENDIRFPEGYIYEDTAFFAFMVPYLNKIVNIHEPLFYRVVRENSTMTTKQGERTAQIFPVMESVVNFYEQHGLTKEYRDELEYFYMRILLFGSINRISHIRDKKLRRAYSLQSLKNVKEKFPNYKKNPYLKGGKKLYIRLLNPFTVRLVTFVMGKKKLKV